MLNACLSFVLTYYAATTSCESAFSSTFLPHPRRQRRTFGPSSQRYPTSDAAIWAYTFLRLTIRRLLALWVFLISSAVQVESIGLVHACIQERKVPHGISASFSKGIKGFCERRSGW